MALSSTKRSKRKAYVCEDCGKSEGFNRHQLRCDSCGGTVREMDARAVKVVSEQAEAFTAEQQAIVEILSGMNGVRRKECHDAVRRLTTPKPDGEGRDVGMVRNAAEFVAGKHKSAAYDSPIGAFINRARTRPGTSKTRTARTPESAWEGYAGLQGDGRGRGDFQTVGELLDFNTEPSQPASPWRSFNEPVIPVDEWPHPVKNVLGMTLKAFVQEHGINYQQKMKLAIQAYADEKGITYADVLEKPDAPAGWRWLDTHLVPVACEQCGGVGWYHVADENGETLWEAVTLENTTGMQPKTEQCRHCHARDAGKRLAGRVKVSGLADAPLLRLEDMDVPAGLTPAWAAVERWVEGEILQVVLTGPSGRGKTHLAIGALVKLIEAGVPGYYLNIARFLDELRGTYDESSEASFMELMSIVQEIPALVIDDLGAERRTEWAQEKVYELVDARYASGLRTIACSNYEPDAWDERVLSRLCDRNRGEVIAISSSVPDYRLLRAG